MHTPHSSLRVTDALVLAGLLAGAVALVGCQTEEPKSPSPQLTSATAPRLPSLGRGAPRVESEGAYHIYVADPVLHTCSGSVPFFDFDSSMTRTADQPSMQLLADCMTAGPLQGKSIVLIGRTDPRGSEGYNDKLGLERAERVQKYLVDHGIDAARVEVKSEGEEGATPDPAGWAKDRRVEVRLAP